MTDIASAVNNAVARLAGLVGVSIIGVIVAGTLVGYTFTRGESVRAFHEAITICVALVDMGGLTAALGIVKPAADDRAAGLLGWPARRGAATRPGK